MGGPSAGAEGQAWLPVHMLQERGSARPADCGCTLILDVLACLHGMRRGQAQKVEVDDSEVFHGKGSKMLLFVKDNQVSRLAFR